MGKVLFWIIVIFGGLLAARILARHHERSQLDARQPKQAKPIKRSQSSGQPTESMVRCAHCGIHLPRTEAILFKGKTWCSQELAQLTDQS